MRLLLDTHLFLWCVIDDKRLTKSSRNKIQNASEIYISSASIWELAIKIKIKKLQANIDELLDSIEKSGFIELPVTAQHAATVCKLDNSHKDPFDRILLAQAIVEPLTFLTADVTLKNYSDLVEVVE